MARNEEKQQGKLNRLWLQKEREGKRKQLVAVTSTAIHIWPTDKALAEQMLALTVS